MIKLADISKLKQNMKVEKLKIVQFMAFKVKLVLQEKILYKVASKNKNKY